MSHTSCSCPLCVPDKPVQTVEDWQSTVKVTSSPMFSKYGWICPKCQNVFSPALTECYKCNGSQFQVTGTSVNINATVK